MVDRSTWKPGPWDGEPDHVEFRAHGLPCIIHRNHFGVWCGYVGVPPGHPWHGMEYDSVPAEAHGGLTYASGCAGDICHVPEPGEADAVWWLGFDCNHYNDARPVKYPPEIAAAFEAAGEYAALMEFRGGVYRTVEYVREETTRLAAQAAGALAG